MLNAFPPPNDSWELGPIAVLNVRGASVFWYEGSNGKALIAGGLALITLWAVARWRRHVADTSGVPPARACGRSRPRPLCWS